MKLFLDNFSIYNDRARHLIKLHLYFEKCQKPGISLNLEKCSFLVYFGIILGHVVFKGGTFPDPKKKEVI